MAKTIWAPLRIEYILGDKTGGCFLCKMFAEGNDSENLLLTPFTAERGGANQRRELLISA